MLHSQNYVFTILTKRYVLMSSAIVQYTLPKSMKMRIEISNCLCNEKSHTTIRAS